MKLKFDDYLITTDCRQYIISKKGIVKGEVVYKPFTYVTMFDQVLKSLSDQIVKDNDEIQDILKKLEALHELIDKLYGEMKKNV